jgi:hypothetical protein
MEKEANNQYIETTSRNSFILRIPFTLRFGLIWTLFFAIIGIVIQYLQVESPVFFDIIKNFFNLNFINWLKGLGTFTNVTLYQSESELLGAILGHWYYFFYLGGLLSLIWGFLSWIIHAEIAFKKRQQLPIQVLENKSEDNPPQIKQYLEVAVNPKRYEIEDWIDQGLLLLAEKNIKEAELIYEQIRRAYDSSRDLDKTVYKRILDYYSEIVEEKSSHKKQFETWEG